MYILHPFSVDISVPVVPALAGFEIVSGEKNSHVVEITVTNAGVPVSMEAATTVLDVVRLDGTTVAIEMPATENVVSVALPIEAGAIPGRIRVKVFATQDGADLVILDRYTTVRDGITGTVVDPGTAIPSLGDIIAEFAAMEAATADATAATTAANTAAASANTAAGNANTATANANNAATSAQSAASGATASSELANSAASAAAAIVAGLTAPAGTYANISALNAANPDHSKIYVTLDDGNWCYYNAGTSAFVSGGPYQAAGGAFQTSISPEYDPDITYVLGSVRTYLGTRYKCTTAITVAEAWTAGHWTEEPVQTVLDEHDSQLADIVHIGTNLFNKNGMLENKSIEGTGVITSTLNWIMQSIDVTAYRGKYIKTNVTTYGTVTVAWYDDAGNFISRDVGAILATSSKLIGATYKTARFCLAYSSDKKVRDLMIAVSDAASTTAPAYDSYGITPVSHKWKGKKIVWFGTSIPAGYGGHIGSANTITYPAFVGSDLGATVYNEAIGSSAVHCKQPDRVNAETNPYGFIGNFEAASRCLSNTVAEMQWICDNYQSDIWTSGQISEATWGTNGWWEDQILSYGYETKLDKYLTKETFPDLFIFDHGHNDGINSLETENSYYTTYGAYNLYTFRGAMNFLIKRILDYNPNAKIVIIGENSGDGTTQTNVMQSQVASDWCLPFLKLWEKLGWSKTRTIELYGQWINNSGVYSWAIDSVTHSITIFNVWNPDNIHAHSDLSQKALNKIAHEITTWLTTEVITN